MKKILPLVIFLVLSIIFTACSGNKNLPDNSNDNSTTVQAVNPTPEIGSNSGANKQIGDIKDILLKSGELPNDLVVAGVKDEKNVYCFAGRRWKNIYLYNIETRERKIFREPISSKRFIKTAQVNEDWIVWNEDEDEVETDFTNCTNWATYAQNLKTGEIIEIDKFKKFDLAPDAVYKALAPRKISLYGNKIVYNNFDLLEDKNVYDVIKLYDLAERKMTILDSVKDYKSGFHSQPEIYGNYIVWSYSKCNLEKYTENGDSFLYDISKKEKTKISTSDEILWPYINKNYIAARVKPKGDNENSRITLYNMTGTKVWEDIVNPDIEIYKNETHVSTYFPTVSQNYLYWTDNIEKIFAIYNISDKKFYKISEAKEVNKNSKPTGIYGKMVFWWEITNDEKDPSKQEVVYKYGILR